MELTIDKKMYYNLKTRKDGKNVSILLNSMQNFLRQTKLTS